MGARFRAALALTATAIGAVASIVPAAGARGAAAPVNTVKPSVVRPLEIPGHPEVGERLIVNTGTWTGGVSSYAFRWERCPGASEAACATVSTFASTCVTTRGRASSWSRGT